MTEEEVRSAAQQGADLQRSIQGGCHQRSVSRHGEPTDDAPVSDRKSLTRIDLDTTWNSPEVAGSLEEHYRLSLGPGLPVPYPAVMELPAFPGRHVPDAQAVEARLDQTTLCGERQSGDEGAMPWIEFPRLIGLEVPKLDEGVLRVRETTRAGEEAPRSR